MSKPYNIVHISNTPLVAAPSKLASSQRKIGHNSIAIALNDYPGALANMFISEYIKISSFTEELINRSIQDAHIIHIHNDIPSSFARRIITLNQSAKYIYQAHSPLREGPLYISRAESIGLPFNATFVVGQFQPRLHNESIIVPNIISEAPSLNLRKSGEKLRVLFSPTHKRPGRWNNKFTDGLDLALKSLSAQGKIEAVIPENPVSPQELMSVRKHMHVTIDEIATGGFHQVSLEGLAAGNVVINKADYFSKVAFSLFSNYEQPPFHYSNGDKIYDDLLSLSKDIELTNHYQQKSYDYFCEHLKPEKMATYYDTIYQSI